MEMEKWWKDREKDREIERKKKEQESAEAISGLKKVHQIKATISQGKSKGIALTTNIYFSNRPPPFKKLFLN